MTDLRETFWREVTVTIRTYPPNTCSLKSATIETISRRYAILRNTSEKYWRRRSRKETKEKENEEFLGMCADCDAFFRGDNGTFACG